MSDYIKAFESFVGSINEHVGDMPLDGAELSHEEVVTMGHIWDTTNNFIINNNLATQDLKTNKVETIKCAVENIDSVVFDRIQSSGIAQLVDDCKVPGEFKASAIESVGHVLTSPRIVGQNPGSFLSSEVFPEESANNHVRFIKAADYIQGIESFQPDVLGAVEEFGKNSDQVVSDLRLSIAITILKYHKGLTDRLIHRRTNTENVVRFRVVGAEVLDLKDTTATVDNNNKAYTVGKPFIEHYHDPSNLDSTQAPVVPLKDNDTDDVFLLEDGVLKFGEEVPTLNLSLKNEVGYDRMDHSDLVAEGVTLKTLRLKFKKDNGNDPATEEIIEFNVTGRPRARFIMQMNTSHSGDRILNCDEILVIDSNTKTKAGDPTSIFSDFTGDAKFQLHIRATGKINLNNGISLIDFAFSSKAKMVDGSTPSSTLTDLVSIVTVDKETSGYELEEYFSEENIRKSSTLIRTTTRTLAYEIPGTKNILVDFSLNETRPDEALGMVTEAMNLGLDYKNINLMLKQMSSVYNRLQQEKNGAFESNRRDGVRYDYPAGLRVNPYIYQDTFNVMDHVDNEWSGQKNGDVRSALENYLMEMFAMIHSQSLYVQALNPGEKIVWRCLTSGPIKELLFNIPHYHNHLNTRIDNGNNSDIEYTRVLPNGVVLEMFTTSWNMMNDTILFVPFRKAAPKDVTNFAFNADMGSYVANIQVQTAGAAYKRIITNAKEIPIVTNPVAAKVTLTNVAEIFNGTSMGFVTEP